MRRTAGFSQNPDEKEEEDDSYSRPLHTIICLFLLKLLSEKYGICGVLLLVLYGTTLTVKCGDQNIYCVCVCVCICKHSMYILYVSVYIEYANVHMCTDTLKQ